MSEMEWTGVIPAITTPFLEEGTVDYDFLAEHCNWLVENGVSGLVPLGSLGEGATLDFEEKTTILGICLQAADGRVPVAPGIGALGTKQAVALAVAAEKLGCRGLMVLPPYVHQGDWRETQAHFSAVLQATGLSCMLYNNPKAYGTDVRPWQVAEMAVEFPNLRAMKESSGDVRRITTLCALLGDRIDVLAGLDDILLEGVAAGATGWVAGLVNALPAESVELFRCAQEGKWSEATVLYHWFLPLLQLDTMPKFVQLIKLVQQEVGRGSERVRLPRLKLAGEEREEALELIRATLKNRPHLTPND